MDSEKMNSEEFLEDAQKAIKNSKMLIIIYQKEDGSFHSLQRVKANFPELLELQGVLSGVSRDFFEKNTAISWNALVQGLEEKNQLQSKPDYVN